MLSNVQKKTFQLPLTLLLALLGFAVIIYTKSISKGIIIGLDACFGVIIPSLFPFMVLSSFLSSSGLLYTISAPFSYLLNKLIGLPYKLGSIFLLSLVGGFPVGAKAIVELYQNRQINRRQASYALCFCVNAGPAFLFSAVGVKMFASAQVGIILIVSNLLTAFTLCLIFNRKLSDSLVVNAVPMPKTKLSLTFVNAVSDSSRSLLTICSLVVIFSAIITLIADRLPLSTLPFGNVLPSMLYGFLEVTAGCVCASLSISKISIVLACAGCGFCGLCVISQIYAICAKSDINMKPFIPSRVLAPFISAIYSIALLTLFPLETQTFIGTATPIAVRYSISPIASILLLLCCLALLLSFKIPDLHKQGSKNTKNK